MSFYVRWVPDCCTQEMCDKAGSKELFMFKYCHDRYKSQERCDKAVDTFLPTFVPNWFVVLRMREKIDNDVFSNYDIDLDDADSYIITFFSELINADRINVKLDNNNFNDEDLINIVHVGIIAWYHRFKQRKVCNKIGRELMPVAWNPSRCWDWCITKDGKKKKKKKLWNGESNV